MFLDVFTSWPEEVDEMTVTAGEGEEEEEPLVIVVGSIEDSFEFYWSSDTI